MTAECYDGGSDVGYQRFHVADCPWRTDAECRRETQRADAEGSRYDSIDGATPPYLAGDRDTTWDIEDGAR